MRIAECGLKDSRFLNPHSAQSAFIFRIPIMTERLTNLAHELAERRVLVVGDLGADQFVSGEISRVSREALVLILRHERTETVS